MEMQSRHAAILGELSELSLSLARDLHQAALDAEEPAQKAALASSFHKLSRSVRQTLALEAKLHRDARAAARQAQTEADHAASRARQKRKNAIQDEVSRLIWTESERLEDENNELEEDLEAILIFNDLPDLPEAEIIRQLAERLGLPCPPPQGEGDREAVEGVEAHKPHNAHQSPISLPLNPLSRSATAPPEGEHLTPTPPTVMAGPVPAIHAAAVPDERIARGYMDHPDKPGDDECVEFHDSA